MTAAGRAVLECVRALEGRYGMSTVLATCRGAPPAKHAARLSLLDCCGAARDAAGGAATAAEVARAAEACRSRGLLEDVAQAHAATGGTFSAPRLTAAGEAWLADAASALAAPAVAGAEGGARGKERAGWHGLPSSRAAARAAGAGASADLGGADAALFDRLRAARRSAAGDLPPYVVCSDKALRDVARAKPRTPGELLAVSGFGAVKVERYGEALLAVVRGEGRE